MRSSGSARMDYRKSVTIRRENRELARNPEFVASGIPSPPARSPLPLSVSPGADSLGAFATADDDNLDPRRISLRLSEFFGSKKREGKSRKLEQMSNGEIGQESKREEDDQQEKNQVEDFVLDSQEDGEEIMTRNIQRIPNSDDAFFVENMMLKKLMDQMNADVTSSVPDDEISQNKQDQDDEILALDAIYEGSFKLLDKTSDGLHCFMIEVSLEATDGIEVFFLAPSHSSGSSNYSRPRHNFTLQYLLPIRLMCILPSTYPSRSQPHFVLEAQWLSTDRLVRLSDKMEEIWQEQGGDVVLFAWAEFLHSQALSFIGASEKLELVSQEHELQDPRVLSGSRSPEDDAVSLLCYNEEMQHNAFLNSSHLCTICFEEFLGRDLLELPCKHFFCRICMQQFTSVHVSEGSIHFLRCPNVECKGGIPPSALKELLSAEDFDRWERLCLQRTLNSMSDINYCPRCDTACIEDTDNHVQCGQCFFNFCGLCRCAWHVGQLCLTPEARLEIVLNKRKGQLSREQRRRAENLANELKNLEIVQKVSKPCPWCGMAISKTEGCNKMTCASCGNFFCFKCLKKIQDYGHFRGGHCSLFDVDDRGEDAQLWQQIEQYEQQEQLRQQQLRQRLLSIRIARPCPSCRQQNAKVGNNNHIFCTSCQSHYCGQCHKIVRKASEHYGPNKCKQHSADDG